MTPHKHAEVIKAWADGAEIQYRSPESMSISWNDTKDPAWNVEFEYRVKPQPKKCVPYKRYLYHSLGGETHVGLVYKDRGWNPEPGNSGFIDWIDTEWQEHEYE